MRHRRRSGDLGVRDEARPEIDRPGRTPNPVRTDPGPRVEPGRAGAENEGLGAAPATREVHMDRGNDRSSEVSVVGRGTRIEGKVVAAGSLRVEGEVTGAITARGDVSLSPEGRVEANI